MINLEKEIRFQPQVLKGVKEKNLDTVKALVAAVKKAGITNVSFTARGTSDHAAIYGQYLIGMTVGIPCGLTTPSVISKYNGKLSFNNTLVIGISQSGMAEDVLELMKRAKETGAIVASITNNPDSPIAKTADFSLLCAAGDEISIAATKTFTSQLYILALVASVWAGDKTLEKALDGVSADVEALLEYMPGKIASFVGKYADLKAAEVLGRGFAYPIALEGALKVLETNKIKMRGYADSDFMHGPIAQVFPGDTVFVIALGGAVADDALYTVNRLISIKADTIVITDTDTYDGMDVRVLRLPKPSSDYAVTDVLTAFTAAVTMQLFALELVKARGIDPDRSDVIKKITITK